MKFFQNNNYFGTVEKKMFFSMQINTTLFICVYLQSPGESIPTQALSGCSVARSSSPTLAPLQTALPKGPCWTGVLTEAAYEPRRTLTCPLHRIAQSSVLTFALLAAAGPPVLVITGWKVTGQTVKDRCRRRCCQAKISQHNLDFNFSLLNYLVISIFFAFFDEFSSDNLVDKIHQKKNQTLPYEFTFF